MHFSARPQNKSLLQQCIQIYERHSISIRVTSLKFIDKGRSSNCSVMAAIPNDLWPNCLAPLYFVQGDCYLLREPVFVLHYG